jgi:hypothetical protein
MTRARKSTDLAAIRVEMERLRGKVELEYELLDSEPFATQAWPESSSGPLVHSPPSLSDEPCKPGRSGRLARKSGERRKRGDQRRDKSTTRSASS